MWHFTNKQALLKHRYCISSTLKLFRKVLTKTVVNCFPFSCCPLCNIFFFMDRNRQKEGPDPFCEDRISAYLIGSQLDDSSAALQLRLMWLIKLPSLLKNTVSPSLIRISIVITPDYRPTVVCHVLLLDSCQTCDKKCTKTVQTGVYTSKTATSFSLISLYGSELAHIWSSDTRKCSILNKNVTESDLSEGYSHGFWVLPVKNNKIK